MAGRISAKVNWKVYLVSVAANIASLSAGITYGWSTPSLPKLNGSVDPDNNPLGRSISKVEESWIASLVPLGAAIFPAIFGILADKIGRKNGLILTALPLGVGFLLLAFTANIPMFLISRFMCGMGLGGIFTVVPMYVGEIAEVNNRGAVGCFLPTIVAFGIWFSYLVGPYVGFTIFNCINALPVVAFLCIVKFLPESPHYLVMKGDVGAAESALRKLRNSNLEEIKAEMTIIKQIVATSQQDKGKLTDFWTKKGLKRGILLTIGMMVFQQLTGIGVVIAHMQTIFDDAKVDIPSEIAVIIIGFLQFLSSASSSFLVEKIGRRFMLLVSFVGSGLSQLIMGVYFTMKTNKIDVDSVSWLPVLTLVVFVLMYNMGLAPLPWVIVSEIFPQNAKSIASTVATSACLTTAFILVFCYPVLSVVVVPEALFFFFTICCTLGFAFLYYNLPETKGKSYLEIQKIFNW